MAAKHMLLPSGVSISQANGSGSTPITVSPNMSYSNLLTLGKLAALRTEILA